MRPRESEVHRPSCSCHSHNGLLLRRSLAQREYESRGLDAMDMFSYLDKSGSVSGLELERDLFANILDSDIDEQARRFHHGS